MTSNKDVKKSLAEARKEKVAEIGAQLDELPHEDRIMVLEETMGLLGFQLGNIRQVNALELSEKLSDMVSDLEDARDQIDFGDTGWAE